MLFIIVILIIGVLLNFVIPTVIGKYIGLHNRKVLHGTGVCYLTFDDGPSEEMTGHILEAMKVSGVKATFFLSGRNVKKNPDVVVKIVELGHTVGEHGFSHLHPWRAGPVRSFFDAVKGAAAIEEATENLGSQLYRPPYGKFNIGILLYVFLKKKVVVLWDVDSKDFEQQTAEEIFNRIEGGINPGQVILFHDGGPDGEPKNHFTPAVIKKIVESQAICNLEFGALQGLTSAGFGFGSCNVGNKKSFI
jgi:peptidoglycan/xylan/chitin deacetylase (PgdA/CDA1 family)